MMSPTYSTAKAISFADYLAYDDGLGRKYELLDHGELAELPFENDINVTLAMDLYEHLKQFVNRQRIRMNATAVEVTPMSVQLPNGRTRKVRQKSRIPDLMILTKKGAEQIRRTHSGLSLEQDNPLLIVEFVSESNSDEDYIDKKAQYEARGIPEYWIADRHQRQVTVLILRDSRYVESCYQNESLIQSAVFPTLSLSANALLTEDEI